MAGILANRFVRGLLIALISVGLTSVLTVSGSFLYFQGKVDTLERSLGAYAIREATAAADRAVDAVEKAEARAVVAVMETKSKVQRAIGISHDTAQAAISESKEDAVAVIADAHNIAPNARAVLNLNEYWARRWCDRAGVREVGTTYRNTTAAPMEVAVTIGLHVGLGRPRTCRAAVVVDMDVVVDERGLGSRFASSPRWGDALSCTAVVTIPPAAAYAVHGTGPVQAWHELSSSPCDIPETLSGGETATDSPSSP